MIDVNLTGVWRTCRASAPHLIERGAGSMILTSSIAGLRGLVGVAHYTAAKHGVVGLMRSLANELAPHNVRVNTVHPTNVDTPMIQNDDVRRAFRPDLDVVTREQFAEAARPMNMLAIPGSSRSTWPTPACSWPPTRPATSPRSPCPSTRAAHNAESPSVASQERQHGALEGVLGLDHRPVPAVGEHVQFGIGDRAHRDQRHVQRADPVIAAPRQQRRRLRPCASAPTASGASEARMAAIICANAALPYMRRALSSVPDRWPAPSAPR